MAAGAAMAPPAPMPAKKNPCARPRSAAGIQREKACETFGAAPASAAPNRKRIASRDAKLHANAVPAVHADQSTTMAASTRRGPSRSPSQPMGMWNSAYPHTKALKTHPMASGLMWRSARMAPAAMLRTVRSM